jgi:hypothetical protein
MVAEALDIVHQRTGVAAGTMGFEANRLHVSAVGRRLMAGRTLQGHGLVVRATDTFGFEMDRMVEQDGARVRLASAQDGELWMAGQRLHAALELN